MRGFSLGMHPVLSSVPSGARKVPLGWRPLPTLGLGRDAGYRQAMAAAHRNHICSPSDYDAENRSNPSSDTRA
jgi:hypothetical protein